MMHASIVLFGICVFFVNLMPRCSWCESRNQTCTYVYIIYIYITHCLSRLYAKADEFASTHPSSTARPSIILMLQQQVHQR